MWNKHVSSISTAAWGASFPYVADTVSNWWQSCAGAILCDMWNDLQHVDMEVPPGFGQRPPKWLRSRGLSHQPPPPAPTDKGYGAPSGQQYPQKPDHQAQFLSQMQERLVSLPESLAAGLAAQEGNLADGVLLQQHQQVYQGRVIPLPPGFEEEYEQLYAAQAAAAAKAVPAAECLSDGSTYRLEETMDPSAIPMNQPKIRPPPAANPIRGFKMAMEGATKADSSKGTRASMSQHRHHQQQQQSSKNNPKPARGSSYDLDAGDTNKLKGGSGGCGNPAMATDRGEHHSALNYQAYSSQPAAAASHGVDLAVGSPAWQAALQKIFSEGATLKWRAILPTGERVGPFSSADMTKWVLKVRYCQVLELLLPQGKL